LSPLKSLSWITEFSIVVLTAFGGSALYSIASIGRVSTAPILTDASLIGLLFQEIVLLLVLGVFLRSRDWSLARCGLRISWRLAAEGVWLALVITGACLAVEWLAVLVDPTIAKSAAAVNVLGNVSMGVAALVSIVNPFFEETILCGYVITVLGARYKPWVAINVSTAIRVLCHLYQGVRVITIIPIGLIFGIYFVRTRQLWPILVAHALLDFFGLLLQQ
jgi:membrane protease YdiL (CAAX protease family)